MDKYLRSFEDFLSSERNYSKHTIKAYVTDIKEFSLVLTEMNLITAENELDFAIEDYTKAMDLKLPLPAQIQISYKIGSLYFKQENWKKAKSLLTQCVTLKGKERHYKAYALLALAQTGSKCRCRLSSSDDFRHASH